MTIGERLKKYRQENSLSQEQLAEQLMVSRQAITKWEADRGLPDIDNLISISKTLGITLDELVMGVQDVGEEAAKGRKQSMRLYLATAFIYCLTAIIRGVVGILDIVNTQYLNGIINIGFAVTMKWIGVICFKQYSRLKEQES